MEDGKDTKNTRKIQTCERIKYQSDEDLERKKG